MPINNPYSGNEKKPDTNIIPHVPEKNHPPPGINQVFFIFGQMSLSAPIYIKEVMLDIDIQMFCFTKRLLSASFWLKRHMMWKCREKGQIVHKISIGNFLQNCSNSGLMYVIYNTCSFHVKETRAVRNLLKQLCDWSTFLWNNYATGVPFYETIMRLEYLFLKQLCDWSTFFSLTTLVTVSDPEYTQLL